MFASSAVNASRSSAACRARRSMDFWERIAAWKPATTAAPTRPEPSVTAAKASGASSMPDTRFIPKMPAIDVVAAEADGGHGQVEVEHVWKSNFGRPTPSTRRWLSNCVCSMAVAVREGLRNDFPASHLMMLFRFKSIVTRPNSVADWTLPRSSATSPATADSRRW